MQFLSIAVFCGHSPAYSKNVLWKGSSFPGKRYLKIKVGGLSLPSVVISCSYSNQDNVVTEQHTQINATDQRTQK